MTNSVPFGDIKQEIDSLKKKLTDPDSKISELLLEIESLKESIHELTVVFQKTLDQTKGEDGVKTIENIKKKMDEVVNQNETIAKGMVAISDKLEDFMGKNSMRAPPMMLRPGINPMQNMSMPSSMGGPARMAPSLQMPGMGDMPSMPEDGDLPPPPPPMGRRKQMGGLFK